MSYIHRYDANGRTVYLISDKASKPSGTFSIKQEYWKGRATGGNTSRVLGLLSDLTWTQKDVEEAPKEEPKEEAPEKSKHAVSEVLRKFASLISK